MATLQDIIDEEVLERAEECCEMEHFMEAIRADEDDVLLDVMNESSSDIYDADPSEENLNDPFLRKMGSVMERADIEHKKEIDRIVNSKTDVNYDRMVGIV